MKKEKILYLECYSGISGDMTVGALLDLGGDKEGLLKVLNSLNIDGYHLHFGRKEKCGIDAYDFDVQLESHHHDDDQEHHHDHDHHHDHSHSHDHDHDDDHAHSHSHDHAHDHHHSHSHVHRNLYDVMEIINRMDGKDSVKAMAGKIFSIVAEAESKAHGLPVEQVHFHEVGAIDSIIDIVSAAYLIDSLNVDKVIVSPLAEGTGYVRCQHGVMPVPVPATANIVKAYEIPLKLTDNQGEMVTPTGAAIAAAYHCKEQLPKLYSIKKIGLGAGNKDFEQANILRAMIIEETVSEEQAKDHTSMQVLETNIDDSTGECLGYVMDRLLEAGAADVWYSPVYMKKNRPACTLHVLCRKDQTEEMEEIIFNETTTIGIRSYSVNRTILERRNQMVETSLGEAKVKLAGYKGKYRCYPEYESVKEISRKTGLGFQEVYHIVKEAGRKYEG